MDSGALDTGCKVVPDEKSPTGGTSHKKSIDKPKIVFNFEVKEQPNQNFDEVK